MINLPYRYPLDPTGVNPDNSVVGEAHTLVNRSVRAVAPTYGAFFSESLEVIDVATGQALLANQYKTVEMLEFPTGRYGKEICAIVLITDSSVSPNVTLSYQALGGEYSTNVDAIIQMLNSAEMDNRPVRWPDILHKPDGFVPAMHYHDAGDIYGFEYVVNAIERVRSAILVGDAASHDEILRYVDSLIDGVDDRFDALQLGLNQHTSNTSNPHQTTKSHVGLGAVDNYSTASEVEARAGVLNNRFMTPLRSAQLVASLVGNDLFDHINNAANPHSVNKAQVGLGDVDNYATASQAEAVAGSVNNRFMTPFRVAQAITAQAGGQLQLHVGNTNNPHSTTKAHVGLGNVLNYGIATHAEAVAGVRTDVYMTPTTAKAALDSHANRGDNPHATTKAQVGLGAVMNWRPATEIEASTGSGTEMYMTPYLTSVAINAHANASLWPAINGKVGTNTNAYLAAAFIGGSQQLIYDSGNGLGVRVGINGVYNYHEFTNAGSLVINGRIYASLGFQPSDRRLKQNIRAIEPRALWRTTEFSEWNLRANGEYQRGLVAQDVAVCAPDRVSEFDMTQGEEKVARLAIDNSGLALESAYAAGQTADKALESASVVGRIVDKALAELQELREQVAILSRGPMRYGQSN